MVGITSLYVPSVLVHIEHRLLEPYRDRIIVVAHQVCGWNILPCLVGDLGVCEYLPRQASKVLPCRILIRWRASAVEPLVGFLRADVAQIALTISQLSLAG